jgi:hypothetical protein
MKTIFIIFTLILCSTTIHAQHYIPFPSSNAYWRVDWFGEYCQNQSMNPRYQYILTGDTTMNGKIYSKIDRSGLCSQCCKAPYSPQDGYIGAYRQDTITKKVFFIQNGMTDEQLLYDFSLRVGDTIKGFLLPYGPSGITVYSIDSILLDSIYYRRINSGAIQLIEGIGSSQGLIEPLIPYDPVGWLICFNKNGETVYYNNVSGDSCNIVNGIELNTESHYIPLVYPNPCGNKVSFDINNPTSQAYILTLQDSKGSQLKTLIVSGSSVVLDLSDYTPGLYFYTIYYPTINQHFSGKFIKTNF